MSLVLAGLSFFSCLLVLVLAVVEDTANRGLGVGCYLHEVQVALIRSLKGLLNRQDAQSLSILGYDENFRSANALVDAEFADYASILTKDVARNPPCGRLL
jgi:hypothetical protein